jgi:nucleoside-diphosphate-sugar epimerase
MDEIEEDIDLLVEKLGISRYVSSGSRILILGLSGMIGLYLGSLFSRLIDLGSNLEIFGTYRNSSSIFEKYCPNVNAIRLQDSLNSSDFSSANLGHFDFIFFAVGYGQPNKFLREPLETIRLNTFLLDSAFKVLKPEGTLIYLSSSEIYSGSENIPHSELDIGVTSPNHPRAPYIEAKRTGEAICNIYMRESNVKAKILRVSLVYGPGTKADDTRVLNELIRRASKYGSLELLDSGSSSRAYLYIRDAIEMMINIAFRGSDSLYNVGGIESVTILALGEKIANALSVPFFRNKENSFELPTQGAPTRVMLDMSRYQREFGDQNLVLIDEGIARTISWQKKSILKKEFAK